MKLVKTIALFSVLVIFPIASWYYLNTGKEWRMEGLKELENRTELPDGLYLIDDEDSTRTSAKDALLDKFTVVTRSALAQPEVLSRLKGQFGDNQLFQLIRDRDLHCDLQACKAVDALLFEGDTDMALLDDVGKIRRRYRSTDPEDVDRLVKHVAILMPVEKRKRIDLVRGKDNER